MPTCSTMRDSLPETPSPPKPMVLVFAADARYFYGLAVALAGVLHNSSGLDHACIHIVDGGLSPRQRNRFRRIVSRSPARGIMLNYHVIDAARFTGMRRMYRSAHCYARLLLPELLPDCDEVLYLDADICCGADIHEIWRTDISKAAAAAVRDTSVMDLRNDCSWPFSTAEGDDERYFNSGVMKINLAYWRQHDISIRALSLAIAEPEKCTFWDQTVLNFLLHGAIRWLPGGYNIQDCHERPTEVDAAEFRYQNLHHVSIRKPWLQHSSRTTFRHWRSCYAAQVSRFPGYMYKVGYWLPYLGTEWLKGTVFHLPLIHVLLATKLYRVIPYLTEAIMQEYLHAALQRPKQTFRRG